MAVPPAALEVLRAAERTPVHWKNGGGLTREVAVYPPGSDLTAFDWRVSIAEVTAGGPFSFFPGIDRRMAVLSGRLALTIDGRAPVTLAPESASVAFPGDVPAVGEPQGGPVTDLNVMTRRTRCAASLMRRLAPESVVLGPRAHAALLIALADLIVRTDGAELSLARLDALKIGRGPGCTITARSGAAAFHLIEIF